MFHVIQGVLLQIVVYDEDTSSSDELVDFFQLDISAISKNGSLLTAGKHGFAQLGLDYQVNCQDRFYGENCQYFDDCPSPDVCGPNTICLDGDGNYTCQCESGDIAAAGDCVPVDNCVGMDCSGRGQCMDGVNSYSCLCDGGFTGSNCSVNIDDCVGVNCSDRGQCIDGIDSYQCNCDEGYAGENCSYATTDCLGVNCENGQCVSKTYNDMNSIACMCDSGFTGKSAACNKHCINLVAFTHNVGDACQTNVNDCAGIDCGKDYSCVDGLNSYTCEYSLGYGCEVEA